MDPSTEYKKYMDDTRVIGEREGKGAIHNPVPQGPAGVEHEMRKFKEGKLHSGSKKGPIVTSRDQAVAIALSEAGMSKKKGVKYK